MEISMSGTQTVELEDGLDKELEDRTNVNKWNKGRLTTESGDGVGTSDTHEKFMGEALPWTPFESFEEMEVAEEAQEKAREIRRSAEVILSMIDNVVSNNEPTQVEAKTQNIFSGFMDKLKSFLNVKEKPVEKVVSNTKQVDTQTNNTFTVYKGKDGQMLWLSSYSNNIRDNDFPPEIISAKSHETFVERVDKGELELPKLQMWHEDVWEIGETTVVAYDKDTGAAIAAGYFYKEAETIAKAVDESDIDWGTSHGMPSMSIKRSAEDPTIIIEHITKEISLLPHFAAANKFAGFTVLKEADMALQDEKRSILEEAGIPVDALDNLDAMNKAKSDTADKLELERKEADEVQDSEPENVADEKEQEQDVVFTEAQLAELKSAFSAFGEQIGAEVSKMVKQTVEESMQPLIAEQKEIKETEAQEMLASSPRASLLDMLTNGGPLLKQHSAVESGDTQVDGRTKLAKSGPQETDFEDDGGELDLTTSVMKGIISGAYKNVSA